MPADIDLEQRLDAALAQHQMGQLDLAEADYRAILQDSPDEPDALNLLGLILQERGNLAESAALINRALEIDPDFPEALTNLARVLRFNAKPEDAAEAARRATELDPSLPEAFLQFGHASLDLGDAHGAVTALRRATELAPDSSDAWLQLGVALLRLDDPQAAAEALASAERLRPDRIDIMVTLGVALASLDRLDEARDRQERATHLAPADVAAHAALAVTHRRRGDHAASILSCRRALDLAPERADLWLLLGRDLATTGQLAEAEACCRKALELSPDSVDARRDLAMLGARDDGSDGPQWLIERLGDPATPVKDRIAAGFAAGVRLDRDDRFDAAFAAFEAANRLVRAQQVAGGKSFDIAGLGAYVDWAIHTFHADTFEHTAGWGDPSELPVFIVGMPRSGTTLVEQIAASHPRIHGAGERKDIGDIVGILDGRARNGGSRFLAPAEWDPALVGQLAGDLVARHRSLNPSAERVTDKLPDNCMFLGHIAVLFPNARVIVCRRDPRDVCLSCYFQQFEEGMAWTFDQAELAARTQWVERLMAHWRAVLPLRMLEIGYEDLVADQEAESRRLIDFLGQEWDPACLTFHTTPRPVLTASYWQVRQPLYGRSIGRWQHYRRHLRPLLAGLAGLVPSDGEADWDALAEHAPAALAIAMAHHREGRLAHAQPIYEALLRRDPDDATAMHLLGLLLIDRGDPAQALERINRSLALRPNRAPALADLARAQRAAGNAEAAAEAARGAIALEPDLADAHVQLGCALLLQKDDLAAIEVLQRAITLAPRSLEAHVALATAQTRRLDHAAALDTWEAALLLKPDDVSILIEVAGALTGLERFDEALGVFRRAEALAPHHAPIQYGIAWILVRTGDGASAVDICRNALTSDPSSLPMWLLLGHCESSVGRFAAAAEAYRHALSLDPGSAEAINGLSAAGQSLKDDAAQSAARGMLTDPSVPVRDRIAAGFALGQEADRDGRFDEAFEAYVVANRLLRGERATHGFTFNRADFAALVDRLVATIDRHTFVATRGWGAPSEAPVFIVGMPRSGTSLVEQIAASHPLVFGAGEQKEVFGILTALGGEQVMRAPSAWDRAAVRREALAYAHRLGEMGGGAARVIDKLPDNILCLGQIAILFPRARIIVCRRDLRDVGLSCFFQYFRDDTMVWTDDLGDVGFRGAQVERLMQHWRGVVPIPMLEMQYETLVANLESESRRLIDFLGLAWDPACLAFHETERTVLTASHWQVRQPLYASSVGRWRHYRHHLGPLLQELQGVVPPDGDPSADQVP